MLESRKDLVGSWLGSATQVEEADELATAFVDEHGDSDNVVLIRFADSIASLVLPRFLFLTSRPARIVAITSEGFDIDDSGRSGQHVCTS
jgi:hypothetical protein